MNTILTTRLIIILTIMFSWSCILNAQDINYFHPSYKQIIGSIKQDFYKGNYEAGMEKCFFLIQEDNMRPEYRFEAYYYAAAMSLYNGDYQLLSSCLERMDNVLEVDSLPCDQRIKLNLLEAEIDFEKGDYAKSLDSLRALKKMIEGETDALCQINELASYVEVNLYRTHAYLAIGDRTQGDSLISIAIDSLKSLSAQKELKERLVFFCFMYLVEAYWIKADLEKNLNSYKQAVEYLKQAEAILKEENLKRPHLQLAILKSLMQSLTPLRGDPSIDLVSFNQDLDDHSVEAVQVLTQVLRKTEYKVFKEYRKAFNIRRQIILNYLNQKKTFPLDGDLSELGVDSVGFRAIYGYHDEKDYRYRVPIGVFSNLIRKHKGFDHKLESQKNKMESQKEENDFLLYLLLGCFFFTMIPFSLACYFGIRIIKTKIKMRAFQEKMEAVNEETSDAREALEYMSELKRRYTNSQKELIHIRRELSHRIVNYLRYFDGALRSDLANVDIGKEDLAVKASTRINNAIVLHDLMARYDTESMIYLPDYLRKLNAVFEKMLPDLKLKIITQDFGSYKTTPLFFANDLGQLILEWFFLFNIHSFAKELNFIVNSQEGKLTLSTQIRTPSEKNYAAGRVFFLLEQENPSIARSIRFYLNKYRLDEDNKKPLIQEQIQKRDGLLYLTFLSTLKY